MLTDLQHRVIYLEEHTRTLELRIQNLEKITGLGPKEIESTPVPVKVDEVVTRPIHEDGCSWCKDSSECPRHPTTGNEVSLIIKD